MIKRLFDIMSSFIGLIVLSPVFVAVALWVRFDSEGPTLFRQVRVGKDGHNFFILKFRTMVLDAEKKGLQVTVGRDPRITRSGHFLRRSKLDELPQLINVLKGDMSVVGPRPEVPEYMSEYPDEVRASILSVRPGITDKASIEFTNEAEILAQAEDPRHAYVNQIMPIKARYYLEYVKTHSFASDIVIIIQTLKKIVS